MAFQNDLIREIELLKGRDTIPEAHVLFSLDLYRCQLKAKAELRQETAVQSLSLLMTRPGEDDDAPALDSEMFTYKGRALEVLFGDLCDTLVKHDRWKSEQAEYLKSTVGKGLPDLSLLIRKAALADTTYFESVSETLPITGDGLLFVGFQTGRPLFEMLAENTGGTEGYVSWGKAVCPVCAHEPDMAKFEREAGRRILHCPLCDSEWAFRRLQCPFCLNDDQNSLRFFFVDQKSPYRVDVCDECGRYMKTVDERKLEEGQKVRFAVEDMATIDLDMAAWEEGFRKPYLHVPELHDATVP